MIHEGLFIGLDGTTFIRHVHAAVAGYQRGRPESPRYERTTRLDSHGRVIFQQQPLLRQPTVVSDLNNPVAQARMPRSLSPAAPHPDNRCAALTAEQRGARPARRRRTGGSPSCFFWLAFYR